MRARWFLFPLAVGQNGTLTQNTTPRPNPQGVDPRGGFPTAISPIPPQQQNGLPPRIGELNSSEENQPLTPPASQDTRGCSQHAEGAFWCRCTSSLPSATSARGTKRGQAAYTPLTQITNVNTGAGTKRTRTRTHTPFSPKHTFLRNETKRGLSSRIERRAKKTKVCEVIAAGEKESGEREDYTNRQGGIKLHRTGQKIHLYFREARPRARVCGMGGVNETRI